MMLPYYDPPSPTVDRISEIRMEIRLAQDTEIQNLRLINEFMRSEIRKATEGKSACLAIAAGGGQA